MTYSSDILFGHYPGNISLDSNQAGNTLLSQQLTSKYGLIFAASVLPVGSMVRGSAAVRNSRVMQAFGIYKRPILSLGVHKKVRFAGTAMAISKGYSRGLLAMGIYDLGKNIRLAQAKEYKRLGINVFGPPGSLFMYDTFMADNNESSSRMELEKTESPVEPSLTSSSKTGGKPLPNVSGKRYLLGRTRNWTKGHNPCATGYKLQHKLGIYYCVKK